MWGPFRALHSGEQLCASGILIGACGLSKGGGARKIKGSRVTMHEVGAKNSWE